MNRKQRRMDKKLGRPGPAAGGRMLFAEALRHHQAGRLGEAELLYRQILAADPRHADSLHLLGVVAHQVGRHDVAVELIGRAVAVESGEASFHSNLGMALQALGRLDEAASSYRRAIALKADFAEAHDNLGVVLQALGRPDEAVACRRRALALRPDHAEGHNDLGNLLKDLGRWDEAVACYRRALDLKPDRPAIAYNLGVALQEQGRPDQAAECYRRAIALDPDFAEAHGNLGAALRDQGLAEEAASSYGRALALRPDSVPFALNAALVLPIIPDSVEAIAEWRRRYRDGIAALMDAPGGLDDPGREVNPHSFYLAYHNDDDRPTLEALGRLFRAKAPGLTFTAPHVAGWIPPGAGRRLRVGVLSEFLGAHTIGNLNQGLIRHLDRSRFEMVLIHTPKARRDAARAELDAVADLSITLPPGLAAQQRAVAAAELDVLFYPDIGMAPASYFLAFARLAPVQAVTWGHPDTTGLDTVDYFVLPESFETAGAEARFTETLARLHRVNCCYLPPEAPARLPSRAELGLPETGTLYGCPQSLFKFHPDFDAVLADIAAGDSAGRIVLIEEKYRSLTDQLRARWARTAPVLLERALFLPPMPRDRFMALQARMDVLLDPVHFGGGNTFYEAMVHGVPVVTWPGRFLRSRIAGGAYRQMGVADAPVVSRLEDYAPLALALGRDPGRRRTLARALQAAAARDLFADLGAVREFEAFLDSAVAAAGRGEKLPAAWRPEG